MSFYGMGSILGSYTGGYLTDRKNFFDIMLFSLISCGLILLLMLTTTNIYCIAAIIFFYAFSSDMFRPANSSAIAVYSTPDNRTRSVSLVRLAINLGFSVGPAIGGFVALYLGYKWLFVIDAFTSFAAAVILYIYLPRHQQQKDKHLHPVLQDKGTSAYRDYRYLVFIMLVALFGICFFQLFASIPQYFSKICNYDEDTIGLLLALNGILVVLIEMPLITKLEKSKKIFPFIITGTLCIPVALCILMFSKGWMMGAIIYTFIITLSEIFAMPFMMNFALSRPLKERQGQYSALYSIAFGIANIAAPVLGLGIASRFGFDNMFIFFAGLAAFTALGFITLKNKENATLMKLQTNSDIPKTNFERMIELAGEIFAAHNDPDQLNVDEEIIEQLQRIHPATISDYVDGDGPVCWVLLIPTTTEIMNQFVKGEISETELLNKTPLNESYDVLYLCSSLVLPEYRRRGIAKQVIYKAIKSIRAEHTLKSLFVWNFSKEGALFAETIAKHEGLPLLKRGKSFEN